jgi:magnesium transporter
MIKQIKYQNTIWIDVESPTPEEIKSLANQYNIHPVVAGELESKSDRSKTDLYDETIFLVLHFPTPETSYGGSLSDTPGEIQEIDFVIGQDYLITVHYTPVPALQEFATIFEAASNIGRSKQTGHAGYLFYYIVRHLYHTLEPGIEFINNSLKKIEKRVFAGAEQENVRDLTAINRSLLDFRWALKNHRSILQSLELATEEFFGAGFRYYTRSMLGEYDKVWNAIENIREHFSEVRETNDSLLSIKMNEIMKNLTIMAFLTFPLSLIAAIFGMNTTSLPIVGMPHDFWIITGSMVAGMALMLTFFKYKKWL